MRTIITRHEQKAAAEAAAHLILSAKIFDKAQSIACYFAQDKEFDCTPIIEAIWKTEKKCYLPMLSTKEKNSLEFVRFRPNSALKINRYQILEPMGEEQLPANHLDLVLVPLVGFDLNGNRLGMGGGYYDRTFQFILHKKHEKPCLLGLAYESQRLTSVPTDPWDVPLDGVLTEEKMVFFS